MKALPTSLLILACVAGLFGLLRLRSHTASLRKQVADLHRQTRALESTRNENERLKTLVAQIERAKADATRGVQRDLEQARREVADLEQRAVAQRVQTEAGAATDASEWESNTDPEKGMTQLERFRNVGRGTPAAAFQTAVWAALQADDDTLREALAVTGAARVKAEALLGRLPVDARRKFPTVESLATIAIAGELLKGSALEFAGYTLDGPHQATLRVRILGKAAEAKLGMEFGTGGWQVTVPERAIDAIERHMKEVAASEAGSRPR